jgi:CHC2 zinc finger
MEVAEEMAKKSIQCMNWREVWTTIIRANCTFHDDHIDTLFIYAFPSSTTFHCFGCGEHGEAVRRKDGTFMLSSDEIRF